MRGDDQKCSHREGLTQTKPFHCTAIKGELSSLPLRLQAVNVNPAEKCHLFLQLLRQQVFSYPAAEINDNFFLIEIQPEMAVQAVGYSRQSRRSFSQLGVIVNLFRNQSPRSHGPHSRPPYNKSPHKN